MNPLTLLAFLLGCVGFSFSTVGLLQSFIHRNGGEFFIAVAGIALNLFVVVYNGSRLLQ